MPGLCSYFQTGSGQTAGSGGNMPASTLKIRTSNELRAEVVEEMKPQTVDMLRRLHDADALEFDEAQLLERYDALAWLIDG